MRRILATSIAAAIPALLAAQAVDAYAKPAPPAGGHSRAHHAHAGRAVHGRSGGAPVTETRDRPQNDVKVDADDGGNGSEAPAASEHAGTPAGSGHSTRGRQGRPVRREPASRPGTGADSGFADADEPALPPEAASAIKEADELQHSGQEAAGPQNNAPTAPKQGAPQQGAPQQGAPQQGAPQQGAPQQGAPQQGASQQGAPQQGASQEGAPRTGTPRTRAPRTGASQQATPADGSQVGAPRGVGANGRPSRPVADRSSNQTFSRMAGPVSFFSGSNPIPRGSRLVLHTSVGTSPERTVTLQCDPPGGTHPKAAEACADVAKSGGDLAQMPANRNARACFMIYAPVTVKAQGDWQGQAVRFTEKFPNTCVMRDRTGSVFDF
jgi:Subtilisin inhibitor-like